MTYLLDVNALLSFALDEHQFHRPVAAWIRKLNIDTDVLASCSITELGLIRILPQMPEADFTVRETQELLAKIKAASDIPFLFLTDHMGVDQLPSWVRQPRQTTDGHLAALAKAHGAMLATLDKKIPGAFVIPT